MLRKTLPKKYETSLCSVVLWLTVTWWCTEPTWMTDDSGASGSFQNFHKHPHEPQDQDSLGKKTMRDQILPLQQELALQWNTISCSADRIIERKDSLWPLFHWGQAVMTFLHSLAGSLCKTDAISFAEKADNKHLQLNQADELDPATRKYPAGFNSNPHRFTALTMVSWAGLCHVGRELTAWCQAYASDGFYLLFTVSWKESKIHFSPQDSWHLCAPASSTVKKTRCFLVNLPPNSWARLLLPQTGDQASTVSSWMWSPFEIYVVFTALQKCTAEMQWLFLLERLHAFPCLRSSSLGTHLKLNHCVLKTRLGHEIWVFSCLSHNKMQKNWIKVCS